MANESIRVAFERMWQHVIAKIGEATEQTNAVLANKADINHDHDAYVDLSSDQEIVGEKTFAEGTTFAKGITVGEAVLTFDNETDSIIFSFPDIAVSGEATTE